MRITHERVDLRDLLVGHRIASARGAGAMHHQMRAGTAMGAVEIVRKAHVEGEEKAGIRVHLRRRDRIEPLRRLTIAFLDLRPKLAGPAAHRVGFQQGIFAVASAFPDLQFRFLLVGADQNRIVAGHALLRHQRQRLRRNLHPMTVAAGSGALFTAGESESKRQDGQGHQTGTHPPLSSSQTCREGLRGLSLSASYRKQSLFPDRLNETLIGLFLPRENRRRAPSWPASSAIAALS